MDMPEHATGTREGWLAARLEFLAAEKELSRRGHELARQRQALPWVPIDKGHPAVYNHPDHAVRARPGPPL